MNNLELEAITYLRTPTAIRERCDRIFNLACEDKLRYFRVDLTQLDKAANYVIDIIRQQYPDFNIPFHSRWRHFEVGGIPRLAELDAALVQLTPIDQAKVKFDLAILSVLLDAGAGANWEYYEQETGQIYRRSEGLAVASFRMFCQGFFSSNPDFPFQADAEALTQLKLQTLTTQLQVNQHNPLVGLEGRLELLQRLGQVLSQYPLLFGNKNLRPGNLARYLLDSRFSGLMTIKAAEVLSAVLTGMGEIWPGRYAISGVNLGDVWLHPGLQGENLGDEYVPFHKLSQWLTYSLLEPLQEIGLEVIGLDELTGLPEYRNGGFFLDIGLLQVKEPAIFEQSHLPGSEVIVEWRALTVNLLDKIAAAIRDKLNLTATQLPLVKILQGGTWTAGRRIAGELRAGGLPPIQIKSDGTVF
ncbi:MAG TPA: URC4/urg3 family protein [Kamptonema sp.]|nr:URC4/urg3 family protein [Kamptonema sp.]